MSNFTLNLIISGITCEACMKLIKKKIVEIDGVLDVFIKDNNGETTVISHNELTTPDIVTALQGLPYKVQEV